MKRTPLKRGHDLSRKQELRRRKQLKVRKARRRAVDEEARLAFREAGRAQGVCQVSGSRGPWDAHHVIEAQELRRRQTDEWDSRNVLRVSRRVHEQHTLAVKRIPLRCLTDENVAYAFELMGLAAYPYLRRFYDGHDERVELALAELGAPDACG